MHSLPLEVLVLEDALDALVHLGPYLPGAFPANIIAVLEALVIQKRTTLSHSGEMSNLEKSLNAAREELKDVRREQESKAKEEKLANLKQKIKDFEKSLLEEIENFFRDRGKYVAVKACSREYEMTQLKLENAPADLLSEAAGAWVAHARARHAWQALLKETSNFNLGTVRVLDVVEMVAQRVGVQPAILRSELLRGKQSQTPQRVADTLPSLESAISGPLFAHDRAEAQKQRSAFLKAQLRRTMALGAGAMALYHLSGWWAAPAAVQAAPQMSSFAEEEESQGFSLWSTICAVASPLVQVFSAGAFLQASLVAANAMQHPQLVIQACLAIRSVIAEYKKNKNSDQFFHKVMPHVRYLVRSGVLPADLIPAEWLGPQYRVLRTIPSVATKAPAEDVGEAASAMEVRAAVPEETLEGSDAVMTDQDVLNVIYAKVGAYLLGQSVSADALAEAEDASDATLEVSVLLQQCKAKGQPWEKERALVSQRDALQRLVEIREILKRLSRVADQTEEVRSQIAEFQWLLAFYLTQVGQFVLALELADQCLGMAEAQVISHPEDLAEERLQQLGRWLRLRQLAKDSPGACATILFLSKVVCHPNFLTHLERDRFRADRLPWLFRLEMLLNTALDRMRQGELWLDSIDVAIALRAVYGAIAHICVDEMNTVMGADDLSHVERARILFEKLQAYILKIQEMDSSIPELQEREARAKEEEKQAAKRRREAFLLEAQEAERGLPEFKVDAARVELQSLQREALKLSRTSELYRLETAHAQARDPAQLVPEPPATAPLAVQPVSDSMLTAGLRRKTSAVEKDLEASSGVASAHPAAEVANAAPALSSVGVSAAVVVREADDLAAAAEPCSELARLYERYKNEWQSAAEASQSSDKRRAVLQVLEDNWVAIQRNAQNELDEKCEWLFLYAQCAGLRAKLYFHEKNLKLAMKAKVTALVEWDNLLTLVKNKSGSLELPGVNVRLTEEYIKEQERNLKSVIPEAPATAAAAPPAAASATQRTQASSTPFGGSRRAKAAAPQVMPSLATLLQQLQSAGAELMEEFQGEGPITEVSDDEDATQSRASTGAAGSTPLRGAQEGSRPKAPGECQPQ